MPILPLPSRMSGDLLPEHSTRLVLDELAARHFAKEPMEEAFDILTSWANNLSHSNTIRSEIKLTAEGRDISFADVLEAMNKPQSERFLKELFEHILPHLSSQQQLLEDLRNGHTQTGVAISMGTRSKLSQKILGFLTRGTNPLFTAVETQARSLTWVDDNKNTHEASLSLEVGFHHPSDSLTEKKSDGRKLKF